ncbi:excalibur calcium-binding domain-containing protein [Pseudomonas grandcourensis]
MNDLIDDGAFSIGLPPAVGDVQAAVHAAGGGRQYMDWWIMLEAGSVRTQAVSHHGWIKMKLILVLLVVGLLAWKFSPELQSWVEVRPSSPQRISAVLIAPKPVSAPVKCDGRKYCSQMTSCAEATNFLQNCPGMEMDGDYDGVPCEKQWCR